jgi:hypothetical protein
MAHCYRIGLKFALYVAVEGKDMVDMETQTIPNVNCLELRRTLHELANLFTAILITSGLLKMAGSDAERLNRYSRELLESGERGAVLVREARSMLTPAEERVETPTGITHQRDEGHAGNPALMPKTTSVKSRSRRPKYC